MFRSWSTPSYSSGKPAETDKPNLGNLDIEDADFEEIKRDSNQKRSSS